jgi:tRNA (guanine37-N1)-methyltransferase
MGFWNERDMHIDLLTIFPQLFPSHLESGMLAIALKRKIVKIEVYDLRDYAEDRYRTVDDYPFGGGPGMIMKPGPIFRAIEAITSKPQEDSPLIILLSPQGERLDQGLAMELSKIPWLILLCGRYRGVDQRVRDKLIDREVSIGDYVLTGGELPAMVLVDAVIRLLPGVLSHMESAREDSFYQDLLDYPHYTRPRDFQGVKVPSVLLSGNHQEISRWRRKKALEMTWQKRPDLLTTANLTEDDLVYLSQIGFHSQTGGQ